VCYQSYSVNSMRCLDVWMFYQIRQNKTYIATSLTSPSYNVQSDPEHEVARGWRHRQPLFHFRRGGLSRPGVRVALPGFHMSDYRVIRKLRGDRSCFPIAFRPFLQHHCLPEMINATCLPLPGNPQQPRSNCLESGQGPK